jgi:hypothetical protein
LPIEFYACDSCGHVWTQNKNELRPSKKKVVQPAKQFRVVQPWGQDKGRQGTVQSEHKTVAEAFAALDNIASDLAQTGVPGDAIELVVVDEQGEIVQRPGTHWRWFLVWLSALPSRQRQIYCLKRWAARPMTGTHLCFLPNLRQISEERVMAFSARFRGGRSSLINAPSISHGEEWAISAVDARRCGRSHSTV